MIDRGKKRQTKGSQAGQIEPLKGADPQENQNDTNVPAVEEAQVPLEPASVEVLPVEDDSGGESAAAKETIEPFESAAEAATQHGVVKYDALGAYLKEINQYPALSKEEEFDLALRYLKYKDLEAAYKLITSNLWLVVKIARDYERAARNILDLIQEGNIGLMEAVKNFDPYREVRFPSYAVWWIKAYIIRFIIANWRLVKIGTTQAQRKLFFNLRKERDRLEREGFFAEPKLLAEKLNVKESEVVEMEQRLSSPDLSVDAPSQPDSDVNLLSMLPSGEMSVEDLLAERQTKDMIQRAMDEFASTLKEKELVIFKERMLAEEKATLQDIADKLSISGERVRQIENRLKEKLRVFMQDRYANVIEPV
jgi:RNA polymerase sigma-32 factor